MNWYQVKNDNKIDSPALLLYPDRIQHNIEAMVAKVGGDPKRLCPHVKTHKMTEVVQMQLAAGIERFKCATISELEMTLVAGAKNVLIAYQLTGPKIDRFLTLVKKYPSATISSLVDNLDSARQLARAFEKERLTAGVYLDIDNGMNRTGFPLNEDTSDMIVALCNIENLRVDGLHLYDGQFRDPDVTKRQTASDAAFHPIYELLQQIDFEIGIPIDIINGGSPSFAAAANRDNVYCSPGTTLLWDYGYSKMTADAPFQWAAVLMTRVISKPTEGIITLDLGHKSVASENPLAKRIHFLNMEEYEAIGHSEEHLVLKVANWKDITVGDVFYGVPYHVCPSVALHEEAHVVRRGRWVENWEVVARKRRISV